MCMLTLVQGIFLECTYLFDDDGTQVNHLCDYMYTIVTKNACIMWGGGRASI